MTHAKATAGSPAAGGDKRFDKVKEAIRANIDELRQLEGVVAIRPGFLFQDGWITNQPAIVLAVDPDVLADPEKLAKLPESADGVPVDLGRPLPPSNSGAFREPPARGVPPGQRSRHPRTISRCPAGRTPLRPDRASRSRRGLRPSPTSHLPASSSRKSPMR